MSATEYVVLVDENDHEIGRAEKMEAHQKNLLHRAFSIFIFCGQELLLQQRALNKYHSPGLWTNTCCSHPRPEEAIITAGERRLQEELGFITALKPCGYFLYNAHFDNGLSENELDHVLVGHIDDKAIVKPDPNEVQAIRWISVTDLQNELSQDPSRFTPWLKQALALV